MPSITTSKPGTLLYISLLSLTCFPSQLGCTSSDSAGGSSALSSSAPQPGPQLPASPGQDAGLGPIYASPQGEFAAAPPANNAPGPSPAVQVNAGAQGASGGAAAKPAVVVMVPINPVTTDATTQPPAPDAGVPRYYSSNPFVEAEHDPQSTFAADVDTASYDLFRQYVRQGGHPSPSSVRLEEFINFFSYEYPSPDVASSKPFTVSLDAAPDIADPALHLLRVGIQARPYTEKDKRQSNLVFLVDISGSMREELPMVQAVLRETLNLLAPEDRISIVTYAGATRVALTSTQVSEKSTILAAIDAFTAGGSTAGSAGLALAYEQADAGFLHGGLNHIILCTDGDFNVGVSSNAELLKQITEHRKTGVTFTGLGFGTSGVNDAMLEAVSDAGNGVYSVISSIDDGENYVQTRMLQNLTYVAKDVKFQVEFNPKHVLAYRLLGYEDRNIADQDFRNDVVDAGEVGAGHRVTALYQVVLADGSIPNASKAPPIESGAAFDGQLEVSDAALVRVKVRYKDIIASEIDPAHEVYSELEPGAVLSSFAALPADARWAAGVSVVAEILKESPYRSAQELSTARSVLKDSAGTDPLRAEFLSLVNASLGSASP